MLLRHATSKLAFLIVFAFGLAADAVAQTDKASQVISEMLGALGGKQFLEVREIQSNGRAFSFKAGRPAGTDVFSRYIKFPDKARIEIGTYKIKPTEIHNGDAGWEVNDKKIEPISAANAKAFQAGFMAGFQYVARFVLNRPGLVMQHVGSELVEFKRNDVIEFRDSGSFYRLYVDQQSHLPTKLQVRRNGESFLREDHYANWHEFQGIKTALFTIQFQDGEKTGEVRLENVIYNPGMADSLFAPPSPASK